MRLAEDSLFGHARVDVDDAMGSYRGGSGA